VARRYGKGPDFIARAARARWEEGLDICDPQVVGSFGDELGIDADALAGAAQDPQARKEGIEALLSIHRDGVFGVPFFVHRYDKFWGLDRLPEFAAAVAAEGGEAGEAGEEAAELEGVRLGDATDSAGAAPAPQPLPALGLPQGTSVDDGHAGGCG
jgi:predicted DsbA family dithiol-disulfide isomerase